MCNVKVREGAVSWEISVENGWIALFYSYYYSIILIVFSLFMRAIDMMTKRISQKVSSQKNCTVVTEE